MLDIVAASPSSHESPPTARHLELQRAAQQFEAVMLGELMKPLQHASSLADDDEEQSSPLQSYGVEAMAGALARSGAFGFVRSLVRSVERHEVPDKVTTQSRSGTQVR